MKLLIKIIFAIGMFVFFSVFQLANLPTDSVNAETKVQMWNRVLSQWEVRHPDIVQGCDSNCVSKILEANPWLPSLAQMTGQPVERHAKAYQSFGFDKGLEFEKLYKRPPTIHDWNAMFTTNAEQWRAFFDVGQSVYAVDQWTEPSRQFRYKLQFCGDELKKQAKCW